jgi:hypothetical protein
MKWHIRYWFFVIRDWFTCQRGCISTDQLVAKEERDPEMRQRIAEARSRLWEG